MNRRDRKNLEKRLGILKHVKTLSRKEKFERMRHNIIEGNQKQREMNETVRVAEQESQDKVDNNAIASLATTIMIKEGLSYIQALEKARNTHNKQF